MKRLATAMTVAILVGLTPRGAGAQESSAPSTPPTTGGCGFKDNVCTGLGSDPRTPSAAEPSAEAVSSRGPQPRRAGSSTAPPFRWERTIPRPALATMSCTDPPGTAYQERQVRVSTGELVQSRTVCVPDPSSQPPPDQPDPVPAPIPVPAPPQQVWQKVPLPSPTWGVSPGAEGLAGLPTRLWDPSGGAPVVASVDLGGFTAIATARPVRYEWTMWDPADPSNANSEPMVASSVSGSATTPAASYTYETKGDYTQRLTITWAGSYSFAGPGVNEVVDLGTTTTTASRTYHVIEVRGSRT